MPIIEIDGLQVQSEEPTDQTTRYLVTYANHQPEVHSIHGMIAAHASINDIMSAYLITNDGLVHRVNVDDVSGAGREGTEWQVSVGEEVIEYVLYIDPDRLEYEEHDVYVVDGWPEILQHPVWPAL